MFHERRAGRVIVLDREHRVLMVRGRDPDDLERGGFLWTPGGGLEDGETVEDGTRREVWEETGLRVTDLGPVVLTRVGEFPFGGRLIRQTEQYFQVWSPDGFEPRPQSHSELEQRAIVELDWYRPSDLRAGSIPFYPYCLADLIDYILHHGPPSDAWDEEQRLEV